MPRNRTAIAVVILATATALGQTSAGPSVQKPQTAATMGSAHTVATAESVKQTADQKLQDMGATLSKMQSLLKKMRDRSSNSKDATAKANLEMWSLMLQELDKEYEQLRLAARRREEFEARRSALYQQSAQSAAAASKAEQAAKTSASPNANGQPSAAPAAPQSPAASQSSPTSPN